MIATLLIAIAAGSASALMFASIVSGALISLLLFYTSSLTAGVVSATGVGDSCAPARSRNIGMNAARRDFRFIIFTIQP